jgi:hypothetical protein
MDLIVRPMVANQSSRMSTLSAEFGYWPLPRTVNVAAISITPLPNIGEVLADMSDADGIDGDWIYAPPQQTRDFLSGRVTARPYASRVFNLPKTHRIENQAAASPQHLDFNIWGLSFFIGMRLTATEAGFVDATPIKPGKLVDFALLYDLASAVDLVERFWSDHAAVPQRARLIAAAIHALFLAQGPQLLQYERFIYCYTALDACYAIAADISPPARRPKHADRLQWMCNQFGMPTPAWAMPAPRASSPIAAIRNATIHEALFMGEPLGFALHGVGTGQNITLEMKALICRLLVALLGRPDAEYVRTPVTTRSRHGLDLS